MKHSRPRMPPTYLAPILRALGTCVGFQLARGKGASVGIERYVPVTVSVSGIIMQPRLGVSGGVGTDMAFGVALDESGCALLYPLED